MDCNVLVVNEEPQIPESISKALRGDGFNIYAVSSGPEALALLDRQPIDVVLGDQGLDGSDLFEQIALRYPQTERVLMSDPSEIAEAVLAVNAGTATRFVTKPWANETIREVMLDARRHVVAGNALDEPTTGWMTRAAFLDRLEGIRSTPETALDTAVVVAEIRNVMAIFGPLSRYDAQIVAGDVELRCQISANVRVSPASLGSGLFAIAIEHDERAYQELASSLERVVVTDNGSVVPEFCFGVAPPSGLETSAEELLERALTALDAESNEPIRLFTPGLAARRHQRVTLEQDMFAALQRDEFFFLMQPQVNAQSLQADAAELLIRWQHPSHGVIAPLAFIDLAERNGLIRDIGMWVIAQGMHQLKIMQGIGLESMRVSVNISPRQFRETHWVDVIRSHINDEVVTPDHFQLEITEHCVAQNPRFARRALEELREAGVRIALDDFGTGNASLSQLYDMPLDVLKFDRSLVRGIDQESTAQSMLRHVAEITGDLGIETVAEGVETQAEFETCRDLGCTHMQGFLFYGPMPPDALYRVLHGDKSGIVH